MWQDPCILCPFYATHSTGWFYFTNCNVGGSKILEFEITTEIVQDSHDFHDKIFVTHDLVVHDFQAESTIYSAFFEVKW